MAFSVNTNAGAFVALQQLSTTNRQLDTTQERISTGLAVGSITDDSSTFLIAQNQRSDLAGLNAVSDSLSRASSTLDVAINAGESVSDLLNQAREIAVSAQDAGLDADSLSALNEDFQAIVGQVNSIVEQAEFNGNNLINGSGDTVSAISGVARDSSITTITAAGTNIRTDSTAATTASVAVGGTVTLGSSAVSDITTVGAFNALFDGNLRAAISNEGLDTNNIIDASDDSLDFGASEATLTADVDGAGLDRITFSIGDADFTVEGDFGATATVNLSSVGTFFGTGSNAISSISVTGSQDVVNGDGSGATLSNVTLQSVDLTDAQLGEAALTVVDNFFNNVQSELARFGSASQQVDLQSEFTSNLSDSVEQGIGNLVDADLARESADLQSLQVQQQLGLQALAIANRSPQSILSLFG